MKTSESAEHGSSPWWPGCFLPGLFVAAVLLVLSILAIIADLDSASVPKPAFSAHVLAGYPDGIPFDEAGAIVDAGLRWLGLTFIQWVVGCIVIGLCVFAAAQADTDEEWRPGAMRIVLAGIAIAFLLLTGFAVWSNTPLMSFGLIVDMLGVISARWPALASLNTAFALLAAWAVLLTISVLLDARAFGGDRARQLRAIHRIVLGAACLLLIWIMTATAMYRLAATLLQASIRDPLLKVAPTVSLGGGLLMSVCLGAAYFGAIVCVRRRHRVQDPENLEMAGENGNRVDAFLETQWVRVVAIALPMLPGVIEMMAQTWLIGG